MFQKLLQQGGSDQLCLKLRAFKRMSSKNWPLDLARRKSLLMVTRAPSAECGKGLNRQRERLLCEGHWAEKSCWVCYKEEQRHEAESRGRRGSRKSFYRREIFQHTYVLIVMIQERKGNDDAGETGQITAGAEPSEEERHCTRGGKGLRERSADYEHRRDRRWTTYRCGAGRWGSFQIVSIFSMK